MKNIKNSKIGKRITCLSLLFLTLTFIRCDDEDPVVIEPLSIGEAVSNDFDFTLLAAALEKAELLETLNSAENYTLLAPSDRAFINAGITDLDRFTQEEITDILNYHLIETPLAFSDFLTGPVTTLNGDIYLSIFGNNYAINGDAQFSQINYQASNGIIHTISEVLLPPERNVFEIIANDSDYSILENAILKAGLESTLEGEGPYTIFAPTNAAFDRFFDESGTSGLGDFTAEELETMLLYHVVDNRLFSTQFLSGNQNTILDETFRIVFEGDIVFRDSNSQTSDAELVEDNRLGTNGVVHNISGVMSL